MEERFGGWEGWGDGEGWVDGRVGWAKCKHEQKHRRKQSKIQKVNGKAAVSEDQLTGRAPDDVSVKNENPLDAIDQRCRG
jgi:hypothetical protein